MPPIAGAIIDRAADDYAGRSRGAMPRSRTRTTAEPVSDARTGLPPATPVPALCSIADHIAAMTRPSPRRYTPIMRYLIAILVLIPSLALADIAGLAKVIDGDVRPAGAATL